MFSSLVGAHRLVLPEPLRAHIWGSGLFGYPRLAFASIYGNHRRLDSVLSPDIFRATVEKQTSHTWSNSIMAPAENINIPPGAPSEPGPLYSDFFQQQVAKQRNNNYHSTSLRNMVATSVNRTALHPGGVQYVFFSFLSTVSSPSLGSSSASCSSMSPSQDPPPYTQPP